MWPGILFSMAGQLRMVFHIFKRKKKKENKEKKKKEERKGEANEGKGGEENATEAVCSPQKSHVCYLILYRKCLLTYDIYY